MVDDDPVARKVIEGLCNRTENIDLIGLCESATQGLDMVENETVDLVFLDVEMPEMDGLGFIQNLTYMPLLIFTTSKTEYAFEAFQHQAVDYLKKPITASRFQMAVERAIKFQKQLNTYLSQSRDIYVRDQGKFIRVSKDAIQYFENVGDYVKVVTQDKVYLIHSTLKNIDQKLDDPRFLKVHRSFIVNLDKIKDIEENSLVIDGTIIPISRANKPHLMGRLKFL